MVDQKPEITRPIATETTPPAPEVDLATAEAEIAEQTIELPRTPEQPPAESAAPTPEKTFRPRPVNLSSVQPVRNQLAKRVEKILEEGLSEPYHRLSPLAQQEFKLKGEQTADKIGELLRSTNVKVKKIFQLIMEWLKLLPGINKFFLEQEAKIKTDRIVALNKKP